MFCLHWSCSHSIDQLIGGATPVEAECTELDIRGMTKHQQSVLSPSFKLIMTPDIEYLHFKPSDPPLTVTLTEKLCTGEVEKLD